MFKQEFLQRLIAFSSVSDFGYNKLCRLRKIGDTEFSFSIIEPILKPLYS